ncbi:hypothetical protein [Amycolatopsis sp. NPDC051903]|uniref:hypothetical protein n=1 Tax=Amycolatopsis sp. NPDC051903 TaxID=3363936 RepID=UPI0037B50941
MGDVHARLLAALDESDFRARRGQAVPARIVTGPRSRIWGVIGTLRAAVSRELLSCDDTGYLIRAGVPERIQARGPQTLTAALDRGVAVRQLTTQPGLLADRNLGAIVHRAGGQARVVGRIPFKLSILDRRVACLPLDHTVLADGFQLIRDPVLVHALVALHRQLWSSGRVPQDAGLPPRLAVLLPVLASDEPDEVACRRIGLSPRTYSRRVAELLVVLGVKNRFQAGAEAGRRGWL